MKSILTLIAATMLASTAHAGCTRHDNWRGPDKKAHVVAGAAIGAVGTLVFQDATKGFLLGVAAGVAKEAYDSTGRGNCSVQDLAATVIGAGLGAAGAKLVVGPRFIGYQTEF